ncbi:MAG: hypothetical protein HC878_18860 [Leptolyngbyaceae cyanobacterium SL_5_14]|nr:hypothetical protein [Leptolyngbyaceae cyanobacterium SL_5_14]
MSGSKTWKEMCDEIQHRSIESTPLMISNAKELRTQIFKCLNTARDNRILKTKLDQIHKLLKMTSPNTGKVEIVGGERNFRRTKDIPHFERSDGCWFDFSILIDETIKPAEIIGFDFEIRFPQSNRIKFLRLDLNLPSHDNEERGLRFHLHPGSDDLMIHSPPMSPLEILHLFLYGLSIPEKFRSS